MIHPTVPLTPPGRIEPVLIDVGISGIIQHMWANGIVTLYSCQQDDDHDRPGHSGYIAVIGDPIPAVRIIQEIVAVQAVKIEQLQASVEVHGPDHWCIRWCDSCNSP